MQEILNRLTKNLKNRKSLIKKETNAYRLYDRDLPQYPYIIDVYDKVFVVYEKGKKIKSDDIELHRKALKHRNEINESIKTLFKVTDDRISFKERIRQSGLNQYEANQKTAHMFTVQEEDRVYLVNTIDYLDTGLFLDHRPIRSKLAQMELQNCRALNLFSYTGSISVALAKAGAHVTSVDLSNKYMKWAEENFKVNNLETKNHLFLVEDVMKFLVNESKQYRVIIIDPPTFSNSKSMESDFQIQDQHSSLIQKCSQLLSPDGVIYFSNNFRKFKLAKEITEKFKVKDISLQSIPKDFSDKKIHQCFEIKL